MPRIARLALLSMVAAALGGCGGGGSDPPRPPPKPPNSQPAVGALDDLTVKVGEEADVQISVTDANAGDSHTVSATSNDTDIASVAVVGGNLRLTGVSAGTATISVTARDNSGATNANSAAVTFEVTVEGGWVAGVFEPSNMFKDFCATPRVPDPQTGETYPDSPGETLDENNWLRSWSNETYLWYDEIVDRNPANYSNPTTYFDLLKTTVRTPSGKPKDRFHFTVPTDEWEALITGAAVGYGMAVVLLRDRPPREVVVAYTEPGSPAERAGLMRGARILKADGVDVVDGSDVDVLNTSLYPRTAGETHEFEILDLGAANSRTVSLTSAMVRADLVQHLTVLDTETGPVGYLLFNEFIEPAERELFDAFEFLSDQDITDLVLDLRYNGGGLLDMASQLAFMIAGPAAAQGRVFESLRFNDKIGNTDPATGDTLQPVLFYDTALGYSVDEGEPLPSVNLRRVFVLAGPGTCSASEAVVNGLRGIDIEVVLIGDTTCGKPYGFYPQGNCGTTYFTVQFQGVNAKDFGDYADGFSPANISGAAGVKLPGCAVADDFGHALSDLEEGRLRAALRYRKDGTCPALVGMSSRSQGAAIGRIPWLSGTLLKRNPGMREMTPRR